MLLRLPRTSTILLLATVFLSCTLILLVTGTYIRLHGERLTDSWTVTQTTSAEVAKDDLRNDGSIKLENATLVMLVRNSEVTYARSSIRSVEDRFNRHYHYPWLFLNDKPFSSSFIRLTQNLVSGNATYARIPRTHWSIPAWVDRPKARAKMRDMANRNILYGGSSSYRHMCRFFSGFLAKQPEIQKYEYYWRVEPNTQLYCDVDYDPFKKLRLENKVYGFVISMKEIADTIETLWPTVQNFTREHPDYVHANNSLDFIVDDDLGVQAGTYNLCHYWTNFEIAKLEIWNSIQYRDYFNYLDQTGKFFYERWGDAPVHSIAASLFLDRDQIHWFYDIGYFHNPFTHCPEPASVYHDTGKCYCDPRNNFDRNPSSCSEQYQRMRDKASGK
ncbi:nucleotide-diphospho-sugar transferase [Lipomyces japonicus]|uniref:nucleotide-diphospho-sugar transferase n=1 Tax=Lipomyces japonicus TaxID=56871 RepID=UPI0034CE3778